MCVFPEVIILSKITYHYIYIGPYTITFIPGHPHPSIIQAHILLRTVVVSTVAGWGNERAASIRRRTSNPEIFWSVACRPQMSRP